MNHSIHHPKLPALRRHRGFALVITLLLLILLTVIAVGLLSLSSISLRSSSQDMAKATAQANARMALILAIGELQKQAGPDARVTAPSGIVDQSAAPLTGVWRSWEGLDHLSSGQPIAPDYYSKTKRWDPQTKRGENGGRFLSWLVSGTQNGGEPTNPSALAFPAPAANTVPILSAGTLGAGKAGAVHLVPQTANQMGKFAWWVSGENQKARLPQPHKPASENIARWSEIAKSHAVPDPEPFGLDALLSDPADYTPDPANPKPVAKAISRSSADLLITDDTKPKPRHFFHDLSTSSVGLLTNTATGGWRKDLSILTENWDAIYTKLGTTGTLPLFRISPDSEDVSQVPFPTTTKPKPAKSIFYPWAAYGLQFLNARPVHDENGCVNSWRHLVDYATFYRNPLYNAGANGTDTIALNWANLPDIRAKDRTSAHNYLHRVRPMPVIARFHWLYSLKTVLTNPTEPDKSKWIYNLQLLVTPVFTLWNPYNISISVPNLRMNLSKSPPCLIQFYKADGTTLPYKRLIRGGAPADTATTPAVFPSQASLRYDINSAFTLTPGQTRVFSAGTQVSGATAATLTPGLNLNGGHLATITDSAGIPLGYAPTDKIKANLQFTYEMNHDNDPEGKEQKGKGIFLQVTDNANRLQMFYFMTFKMTDAETNLYWPPIPANDLAQATAEELDKPADANGVKKATHLFSTVFGSRVVSDTNMPGKGLMQSNPLTTYINAVQDVIAFPGCTHPVNSTLDYSFIAHTLAGDSRLPNAGDAAANYNGFIITGFDAGTGLSRVIVNDLPLRPISSLGQLQHWDMTSQNPRPPFALNIIGNSDATPLIQNNAVARSPHPSMDTITSFAGASSGGGNIATIYDDSYCANHLLFDDWFFSSIAPNPTNFGSGGDDMRTHYLKFLKGQTLLANRDYRPINADRILTDANAEVLADDILTTAKDAWGWRRVASRIEVEGMFNINSTSATAWRALLGHSRGHKIPHFAQTGMTTSGSTDYAVTRFPVSADARAGTPGISGNTEFTGYRVLTDPMLDALVEKIVAQVRLRGPFLSLSEFVNRQLSGDDDDLAAAGAIQTALNQLSDGGANDPMKSLKALQAVKSTNPDPVGDEKYVFRKAAEGKSAYGVPGWIRQADILSPLAPILSARDDTFTIRAYGDSRDGTGAVIAKAWCEATVRRTRDFVDPADPAESIDTPTSATNLAFGRRYEIVTFRWLSPDEV